MNTVLMPYKRAQLAPKSGAADGLDLALVPVDYESSGTHPALVYLASLAPGSRRAMRDALNVIADVATAGVCDHVTMPWHRLRYEDTAAIRAQLAEDFSHRTVNKQLSAMRQVLKTAWRLGLMEAETYQRAADVANVRGQTPAQAETGRALSRGEIMALVEACADGSNAGVRDMAIIAVGYACGLRRAEIVRLDMADYDGEAGTLTIRGKGNKTRAVPVANGARAALEDWIAVRGADAGAIFRRIRRGDHIMPNRMTAEGVYNRMQARAQAAGVKLFSPHDLRRTYAGDLLDAGADIVTVQKLMGHANTATTAGYDRRDSRVKREAAAKLHFPYVGRP